MRNERSSLTRRILRVCQSIGIITAVTLVDYRIVNVNHTTVALTLLVAVLVIAARWGLLESLIASLAGVLCFNFFFLPPVGTWTIADPQNWVAFFAFTITAAVASHLSASAKRRAAEATSRQHEMEQLYNLSRAMMQMEGACPVAEQIARHIAAAFEFPAVVLYDSESGETHRAGCGGESLTDERQKAAAAEGTTVLPVSVGGEAIGSVAVPNRPASGTALRAVAHLAGIALERARAQEAASRAEAVRQSEELKAAILDALAHEFKTPLTAIKAATSSLLSHTPAAPEQKELLQVVDEETDRLTSMVSEAIQTARIEAREIEVRRSPESIVGLIRETLAKLAGSLESRPVEVRASDDLPLVAADPGLIGIVIRQLVDNAAKYSPPGSAIRIRAAQEGDVIVVGVADQGPGIPELDQNRIFERFYRGREARERVPGTGMGLAIAREIIRAHRGEIRVQSRLGQGSEFLFTLPAANGESQP